MEVRVVEGDLLDQPTDVIVNAWNRNIIPWWLLLPHGVSGAIKKRGGLRPFVELGRKGPMLLGSAVKTTAGRLPYRAIIHVAGINMFWRASERSIRGSVRNAMDIVIREGFKSVAFPIIGAGAGGFKPDAALNIMLEEFGKITSYSDVVVVRFKKLSNRKP